MAVSWAVRSTTTTMVRVRVTQVIRGMRSRMGCPESTSVRTQYSDGYSVEKLRKTVSSRFTQNQEASISPKLAGSLRQDSLVQRPLSYVDGLQLLVAITMTPDQKMWQQLT